MSVSNLDVLVAEHGAELPRFGDGEVSPLILQQRSGESARSFSQRVARDLAHAFARGLRVERTGLWVSAARGAASTARRFALARVLLSSMQGRRTSSLALGGALTTTRRGRLDLAALAETLSPLLTGSPTEIELVPGAAAPLHSSHVWPQAA